MDTQIKPIDRYYDSYPEKIKGVELSQTRIHFKVIDYLILVLQWLFVGQDVAVVSEINLYINNGIASNISETVSQGNGIGKTRNRRKKPDVTVPDIMVIDGWSEAEIYKQTSYVIGEDGPPPRAVFEIASPKTWRQDLDYKQKFYERGGVPEYFVFDPNVPPAWNQEWRKKGRLVGWQLDADGDYTELTLTNGQLRSEQLDSKLVVENAYLRLYDSQNQLRLTDAEYERQQKLRAVSRAERFEAEAERFEAERETERRRVEKLTERLRQLGQNPDDIN